MKTEVFKDGSVTHQQSERMVELAEKWLLEYFSDGKERRTGDLEDDFAGEPGLLEMVAMPMLSRWSGTPFFPALGRLVDKGLVTFRVNEEGDVFYRSEACIET